MSASEVPWYVSLIVSWLPFLMLIGIGWYIGRPLRRCLVTRDGRSLAAQMRSRITSDHR